MKIRQMVTEFHGMASAAFTGDVYRESPPYGLLIYCQERCISNSRRVRQSAIPVDIAVPQESADILDCHFFFNVEVNQTIPVMTQTVIMKVAVQREERRPVQLVQQRYDRVAMARRLSSALGSWYPRC